MSPTIQQLIAGIRTREDRDMLEEALTVLKNQMYRVNPGTLEEALKNEIPSRSAQFLHTVLDSYEKGHDKDLALVCEELEGLLSHLVLLRLELAFEPTDEGIGQLSDWVRSHVGEHIILDIVIDKSIFGGARVAFKGRYRESILVSMIAEVLKREKEGIMKELSPSLSL